jgi:predicted Zn-dependent peptidase
MYKPLVLKNGLTLIRIPQESARSCVVGFIVSSGSASEKYHFPQGISNLVSRVFRRGTDKHPSVQSLNAALDSIGGIFTTKVTQETVEYYLQAPHYHQYRAISLLTEIIHRSYFDPLDIERERYAIIDELKTGYGEYTKQSAELVTSNLYIDSSLGLPLQGTIESLMQIDETVVKNYLDHQYQPKKSFIIISGNFEDKGITELIEQEWMFWNPRSRKFIEPDDVSDLDIGELPRLIYHQKGIAMTELSLGFVLCNGIVGTSSELEESETGAHEYLADYARLLVLNNLLGCGLTSKLWSKCVDEELLFATIESSVHRYNTTGFLQIKGITDNAQFSFALESVVIVLESLKKTTVSITELSKAKEYLKGRLILSHENTLEYTRWCVHNVLRSGYNFTLQDLLERIDKVEAPTLRSLALDLFRSDKLVMTTLGTAKETKVVEKIIYKYLAPQQ